MQHSRLRPGGLRWVVGFAALSAAILGLLIASNPTPAAHAQEPPDDCFGGALKEDPLHCYVLEQAHREGVIEVEGVYEDGGGVLRVFLTYPDGVDGSLDYELRDYFLEKGHEFSEKEPDQVSYDFDAHHCDPTASTAADRECLLDFTFVGVDTIVPWSSPYDRIRLSPGGAEARRGKGGWASWDQVWPAVPGGVAKDTPDPSGNFDVSEVNVTDFPELDCFEQQRLILSIGSCDWWKERPGLGVAGWRTWDHKRYYIQVKNPPEDEAEFEALKQNLYPCYDRVGPCYYVQHDGTMGYTSVKTPVELLIIPVKYDFEDLWRWALVLNRFAQSSGNTLGIRSAQVSINAERSGLTLFPLEDLRPARSDDYAEVRETISVGSNDPQRTLEALPTLLPQLGIPIDAVGVVLGKIDQSVQVAIPVPGSAATVGGTEGNGRVDVSGAARPSNDGSGSTWVIAGAAGGFLAFIVLGAGVVLTRRLRREPAA